MKVILLKDVKGQGKQDDIIDVKPGYGTNFLIKNGLAVPASKTGLKRLEIETNDRLEKEQEMIKEASLMKDELEKKEFVFKVKTGKDGKIFGSISTKQIAEELKKQGFDIDKKKIEVENAITTLGYHNVYINLHKKVKAQIKVSIREN